SSLVAGKTAPALNESLEPGQALNKLLQGTSLDAGPSSSAFVGRVPGPRATPHHPATVQAGGGARSPGSPEPAAGSTAEHTITATKTDTPMKDVPQSITVITRDAIKDQNMRSMGDAVRYVPGMNMAQGEGNRDQLAIRGQNTTADFYVDGVRDDVQYFRDFYNI